MGRGRERREQRTKCIRLAMGREKRHLSKEMGLVSAAARASLSPWKVEGPLMTSCILICVLTQHTVEGVSQGGQRKTGLRAELPECCPWEVRLAW